MRKSLVISSRTGSAASARFARLLVVASAALALPLIAQDSMAQKKGKGKTPPAPTAPQTVGDLDAKPATPANNGAAATQAKDLGPPPQAGQMTEDAAKAKRLFDAEKWEEA